MGDKIEPAVGILKQMDMGDFKVYKISCQCGNDSHTYELIVESDQTGVQLSFNTEVGTDHWSNRFNETYDNAVLDWFKRVYNGIAMRMRITWGIWTTGRVTMYSDIMMSEEQALNVASAIETSIEQVKNHES